MNKKIAIILGDGIGPEVTHQSIKVLDSVAQQFGHSFEYTFNLMGADAIDKTGNPLPDETIEACLNSDGILFGAIGHPKYDNDPNAKVRPEQGLLKLRKSLRPRGSRISRRQGSWRIRTRSCLCSRRRV